MDGWSAQKKVGSSMRSGISMRSGTVSGRNGRPSKGSTANNTYSAPHAVKGPRGPPPPTSPKGPTPAAQVTKPSGAPAYALGAWAHFATIFASVFGVLYGLCGVAWSRRPLVGDESHETTPGIGGTPQMMYDMFSSKMHLYVNIFGAGIGAVFLVAYPCVPVLKKSGSKTVIMGRAVAMLLISLPLFASNFTMFQACCYVSIAILYTLSAMRNEQGATAAAAGGAQVHHSLWGSGGGGIGEWIIKQRARHFLNRMMVIIIWVVINCALFYHKWSWAHGILALIMAEPNDFPCYACEDALFTEECIKLIDVYSTWFPFAKGCGLCLDFNCSLILLLITQSVIRRLHEWSEGRGIMYYVFGWMPIHKTILFHKYLAFAIFAQAAGHSVGHLMCQSYTLPVWTRGLPNAMGVADGKYVTLSIWATGYVLLFTLVFMYAVSMEPCRRMMFEAFIYTHRAVAFVWMICLFWHSTVFWTFGIIPVIIHLVDRTSRSYASKLGQAQLLEVNFTPPVMNLVFNSQISYKVGQYVFLKCPWVSKYQGHPFTISSAPETGTLTLHIKVWPGGWTEQVKDFLVTLVADCEEYGDGRRGEAPVEDGFAFEFGHVERVRKQFIRGKSLWKGKQIFHIDGPHSAPAVHFNDYETILVASAGIGLTPLHSILRCLTEYAWRLRPDATSVKTKHLYAVWLCPHKDIGAYRWFMDSASKAELVMQTLPKAVMARVHFEMHLFITSMKTPATEEPKSKKPAPEWMNVGGANIVRPYTPEQLHRLMDNPLVASSDFEKVMSAVKANRANCMGNTHVWNGRPVWDQVYKRIKVRHHSGLGERAHKVGVFFCGTKLIARDLQMSSIRCSDMGCVFEVMKENF